MISTELLKILCCPETKIPFTLASPEEIETLNRRIENKELKTVAEKMVSEPIEEALIREDGRVAYRIEKNIPILLIQEGIKL